MKQMFHRGVFCFLATICKKILNINVFLASLLNVAFQCTKCAFKIKELLGNLQYYNAVKRGKKNKEHYVLGL